MKRASAVQPKRTVECSSFELTFQPTSSNYTNTDCVQRGRGGVLHRSLHICEMAGRGLLRTSQRGKNTILGETDRMELGMQQDNLAKE